MFNCFPYADSSMLFPGSFNLTLLYYNENAIQEGQLLFASLPLSTGRTELKSGNSRSGEPACKFFIALSDPDLPDFKFEFDSILHFSYIDIVLDTMSRDIEGTFNIYLKKYYSNFESPLYADTINLVGNYVTQLNYDE